ncbi:MAG: PepSY domain-containing protein, partial [Armatimonadota bacterium]
MIKRYWVLLLAAACVSIIGIIGIAIAARSGGGETEEQVSLGDVPAAVRVTIEKAAKGGTIREIERETENGQVVYEAEIAIGGKVLEVEIDANGKVLGWEAEDDEEDEDDENEVEDDDDDENLTLEQLPAAVKATILKAAHGGKIKEIELENEGGKPVYEAEILIELEVKVAPDGTLLSKKVEGAGKPRAHEARAHDDDDEDDEDGDERVSMTDLPETVKAAILKAAGGGRIVEIERETENGKTVYEAEVVVNGKEFDIEVAPDGT